MAKGQQNQMAKTDKIEKEGINETFKKNKTETNRQTDRQTGEGVFYSHSSLKQFSKIDFNPQLVLSSPVRARFQFQKAGRL